MKKETIIAIVFGIILGGVVAFFIIFKNKDFELTKNKAIAPKEILNEQVVAPSITTFQPLAIDSPADSIITDKNSVTITGKVEKGSLLVLQSPINDDVEVADKGNFAISFPLALGENSITVVAYPKNNNLRPQEKNLKVYYLDSQL